jgi:hypothetical protein
MSISASLPSTHCHFLPAFILGMFDSAGRFVDQRPRRGRRAVKPNVLTDVGFLAFRHSHFKDRKECDAAVRRD